MLKQARRVQAIQTERKADDIQQRIGRQFGQRVHGQRPVKRMRLEGDDKFQAFLDAFRLLKVKGEPIFLTSHITKILLQYAKIVLPQLYGKEFQQHQTMIARKYRITRLMKGLIGIYARRSGKTLITSACEAVRLLLVGGKAGIFAVGVEQTQEFLNGVKDFYDQLIHSGKFPAAAKPMHPNRANKFTVGHGPKVWGSVRAFSGNLKGGNRGFTLDVNYVDEGGFVPNKQAFETFFPMLRMKNSVIVIISTPTYDEDSWLTQIQDAKWPGTNDSVFAVMEQKQECKICNVAKNVKCPHDKKPYAPWLDGDDVDKLIQSMYVGREEQMQAEMLGITPQNIMSVFEKAKLERLKLRPRIQNIRNKVLKLFIVIDANAGGAGSHTAIIALFADAEGRLVVR